MKKLIPIICIIALASCKSVQIGAGQPNFSLSNGKLCYDQTATATIPEDSILLILQQGFLIGNDSLGVKVNYTKGVLKVQPHACVKIQ